MDVSVRLPVVVGADGSAASLVAVDAAADEAARRHVDLVIVNAGTAATAAPTALLDQAVARARNRRPGLAVSGRQVVEDPARALIDAATQATLVVVGRRGNGGFTGLRLGSVAASVAANAPCPVLICRALTPATTVEQSRPILVGVDDWPSETVIGFAFAEAAMRGTTLVAAHAWISSAGSTDFRRTEFEQTKTARRSLVESALAKWHGHYPDVAVQKIVVHSLNPASLLVSASRMAALTVAGARGEANLRNPRLGSVSRTLIEYAGSPVVVVRPRGLLQPEPDLAGTARSATASHVRI